MERPPPTEMTGSTTLKLVLVYSVATAKKGEKNRAKNNKMINALIPLVYHYFNLNRRNSQVFNRYIILSLNRSSVPPKKMPFLWMEKLSRIPSAKNSEMRLGPPYERNGMPRPVMGRSPMFIPI